MIRNQPEQPSTAILVRGLPGGGKTFVARELEKALGTDRVVMLDPDATDYDSPEYLDHTKQLTVEGVDPAIHAYRFLRAKAYKGIADHKIIIWNQPFTNLEIFNKMTANLKIQADEHNTKLFILAVEVEVDPVVAKQRIAERKQQGGHGPSDHTFGRFVNDYKTFANVGYHTVTVDGSANVSDSVAKIEQALEDLWQKNLYF